MAVQTKAKYSRVVLKLSGEALLGDREFGISPEYTNYLAEEIPDATPSGIPAPPMEHNHGAHHHGG